MKPLSPTVGLDVYVWASRRRRGRTVKISCLYIFSGCWAGWLACGPALRVCTLGGGASTHTQTHRAHTWWFTGCVPTCLLSALWCRSWRDGTDTAENLTQQAKKASIISPPGCLLSIFLLLLLLLLFLSLKLLWTPRPVHHHQEKKKKPK